MTQWNLSELENNAHNEVWTPNQDVMRQPLRVGRVTPCAPGPEGTTPYWPKKRRARSDAPYLLLSLTHDNQDPFFFFQHARAGTLPAWVLRRSNSSKCKTASAASVAPLLQFLLPLGAWSPRVRLSFWAWTLP